MIAQSHLMSEALITSPCGHSPSATSRMAERNSIHPLANKTNKHASHRHKTAINICFTADTKCQGIEIYIYADGLPQYIPAKNSLSSLKINTVKSHKPPRQAKNSVVPLLAMLCCPQTPPSVVFRQKQKINIHKPTAIEASTRNVCTTVEHRFSPRK
ncbi:hypothetical protein TcCL_NonESM07880 [Trypanosoma cruzi]|nr:hypothetical protein TcCL_NonESM07880 [Trypanosoma cruzi]